MNETAVPPLPTVEAPATQNSKAVTKASQDKWGKEVMELGFCIVPSLLLRAQARLKLTAMQLAVLMHLADWWWTKDRKPYPSKKTIGDRLGIGPRQVQRHMAALEKMGFVRRLGRTVPGKGKTTNEYDLAGLVRRLQQLAPELKAVEESVRKQRRAVTRPGMKQRGAVATG